MLALWKQSLKYLEDGQTYRATSFWQKQFTTWIDESIEPTSILFTYQEKKKDSISCGKKEIWRELLTPRCVFYYVLKGAFQMQRTIQKLKWWIQMECYYYLQVVVAEKWMCLNWLILVVSVLFRYKKMHVSWCKFALWCVANHGQFCGVIYFLFNLGTWNDISFNWMSRQNIILIQNSVCCFGVRAQDIWLNNYNSFLI